MTTKSNLPPASPTMKTGTAKATSGVTFELTLNGYSFATGQAGANEIEATLILRVEEDVAVPLSFANGQEFDLEIHDASGTLVNLWSRGKVFSDLAQTVHVEGVRKWTGSLPVPFVPRPPQPIQPMVKETAPSSSGSAQQPSLPIGSGVDPLPANYTLTGYLKTGSPAGAPPSYSATMPFTVNAQPVLEMTAPRS